MAAKIKSRDLTVCAVHYDDYIAKYGRWTFNTKTRWVMEQRKQKRHYETHIKNGCEKHKKATIQYYSVNRTTGIVNVQRSKQTNLRGKLVNQLQMRATSNQCKSKPISYDTVNTSNTNNTDDTKARTQTTCKTQSNQPNNDGNRTSTINSFFKPYKKAETETTSTKKTTTIEDSISIELCKLVVISFIF